MGLFNTIGCICALVSVISRSTGPRTPSRPTCSCSWTAPPQFVKTSVDKCFAMVEDYLFMNSKQIDAVDAALVRDVCNKYIYDKCPVVAAVGPVENCPDYTEIRSRMYWYRV